MTPPGGSNGDGRSGPPLDPSNIIPFPQPGTAAAEDFRNGTSRTSPTESGSPETRPGETAPTRTRSSLPPGASSFLNFPDFSVLSSLVEGQTSGTSGPYARIHTVLRLLANSNLNGAYDANFSRNGHHYRIKQISPGEPIDIYLLQETATGNSTESLQRPDYLLRYFPDGRVGHSSSFDAQGQPQDLVIQEVDQMRRRSMSEHTMALDFIEDRLRHLNQSAGAYRRLEPLLQGLRGRADVGSRSVWFDNYVVLDGKTYTLRTQNLGFQDVSSFPSQQQVLVYEQDGANLREVLRLSLTGEINYDPHHTSRQLATPAQLTLLERLIDQVQEAQRDPPAYREKLDGQLAGFRENFPEHFRTPEIAVRPTPPPRTTTMGPLGEPIHTITQSSDLLRMVRPWGWRAQAHRWQNPENALETNLLRPRGSIRRAMFREWFRWLGNSLWHGALDDHRNVKPDPGSLKLHLLPDGSADLEIFRNYERRLPDGRLVQERGIYNIIRRTTDGTTIDLGQVIKQQSKTNPEFAALPREQQVRLAARQITDNQTIPTSFELQQVPEIQLSALEVQGDAWERIVEQVQRDTPAKNSEDIARGPRTALQALEALQRLPGLENLKARSTSEFRGDILREMVGVQAENHFLLEYPGGYPRTHVEIIGEEISGGKRVVVRMTQGHNQSTAVFDNGQFNPFESTRHNQALIQNAQMGRARRHWAQVALRGGIRTYNYFQLNGRAYFAGQFLSLPFVHAFEHAYMNDRELDVLGHPMPEMSWKYATNEVLTAGSLFVGAGYGLLAVDGLSNFSVGLARTIGDWRRYSELTFRQAYRLNSPRILNPPPILSRPIPRQAWYLRNFAQRGVPLLTGLMAVDMYQRRSFVPNFGPEFMHNLAAVGAVSTLSSGFWAGMSHSLQRQYARHGTETAFRGLSGSLFRGNYLRFSPISAGGSRFSMTFKATVATVALEMIALNIYGSYRRKQAFLAQESGFREDLSSALDRRNRILTRLEHGEAIPPHQIMASEEAVESAYERYHRFLEIIDPREASGSPQEISLENAYSEAYSGFHNVGAGTLNNPLLAQAQFQSQQNIRRLREAESRYETQIQNLRREFGIETPPQAEAESLEDFLTRAVRAHRSQAQSGNHENVTNQEGSRHPVEAPVSLSSAEGRAIIEHLNWKMGEDPAFAMASPQAHADFILREFTGYRVQEADGSTRPWNQNEALAFITELNQENQRRFRRLEAPLTSAAGSQPEAINPRLVEMAEREEEINERFFGNDPHRQHLERDLARNLSDLEQQMEDYRIQVASRMDQAILQFIPEAAFEDSPQENSDPGPLAWANVPSSQEPRSLEIR